MLNNIQMEEVGTAGDKQSGWCTYYISKHDKCNVLRINKNISEHK